MSYFPELFVCCVGGEESSVVCGTCELVPGEDEAVVLREVRGLNFFLDAAVELFACGVVDV